MSGHHRRRSRAAAARLWAVVVLGCCALGRPALAEAQETDAPSADAAPEEGGSPEAPREGEGAGSPDDALESEVVDPPPALPPPTLDGEEPVAPAEPAPAPDEEEERPVILHRIGLGDHPDWDPDGEVPRDVAFETPGGDLRVPNTGNLPGVPQARMWGEDPEEAPRTFEVAVAAGYARLLADEAIDFGRIEERFEIRIPEMEALRLGGGATQMISELGFLIGGGLRLGFGTFFCDAGWVQCEGVASLQPGVMAGDVLDVRFDLNASLDLRFVIEHLVELSIGGGYSLLGDISLLHVTAQAGLVF